MHIVQEANARLAKTSTKGHQCSYFYRKGIKVTTQVKEHPLGEDRRQVCRSGSSRARSISHSAEID